MNSAEFPGCEQAQNGTSKTGTFSLRTPLCGKSRIGPRVFPSFRRLLPAGSFSVKGGNVTPAPALRTGGSGEPDTGADSRNPRSPLSADMLKDPRITRMKKGETMKTEHFDVLVVGSGPAGMAAALAAAREGRKTALLERYGCLGGGMTSSYVRPFLGSVKNDQIGREIEARITEAQSFCSPVEAAKIVLAEMAHEAGAEVYLQTQAVSAETVDGAAGRRRIRCVHAVSHGKEYAFSADAYVDASGDGDLAAAAGADFLLGREADGLVQPLSVMFTIEGIDPDTGLVCQHEEDYRDLGDGREYLDLCHKASASGELPASVNIVRLYATGRPGERMVNATQMNRVYPLDRVPLPTRNTSSARRCAGSCCFCRTTSRDLRTSG